MTPILVVKSKVKPIPNKEQGLTLIEIMVVIALVATIMALGVTIVNDVSDSDLKDASSRLSGTVKYIFNEAVIQKKYYRLVIDLDGQQYYAEARSSPFLVSLNPELTTPVKKPEEKPEAATEEPVVEQPEEEDFVKVDDYLIEPQQLRDPVKIVDVFVGHLNQKATSGKVEIYFFPHGWMEPAVINLTNGEEDNYHSIVVNPATGKGEIKNEYTEANE